MEIKEKQGPLIQSWDKKKTGFSTAVNSENDSVLQGQNKAEGNGLEDNDKDRKKEKKSKGYEGEWKN